MSPFGGDGVNNDMHDAAELAKLLLANADLDSAVATLLSHDGQALTLEMYRSFHATRVPA